MEQPVPVDNVISSLYGQGALNELLSSPWLVDYVVCTMPLPWQAAAPNFSCASAQPLEVFFVNSTSISEVEDLRERTPDTCKAVLGLGGGQALDCAKYVAWKKSIRFVSVPSITSVDAMTTPAAGIRNSAGQVEYLGHVSPNPLVVDYSLIRTAPAELNIAGVGDILSIHTALWDWELAHKHAKDTEQPFKPDSAQAARAILDTIMAEADEIAACSDRGLKAIVDAYRDINRVCLPLGHFRSEEGSEHYVFYKLEEQLGRGFIHGHIVGLGVYLMSDLQQNRTEMVGEFLAKVGLRYHPIDMDITRDQLVTALRGLKQFVTARKDLWFTVIDCTPITEEWIERVLAPLRFKEH